MMRLQAPAKINLHLRVAPPDGSGFHPLMTWMCTVRLFDTLDIRTCDGPELSLQCDDPNLPCDSANLVVRAARLMQQQTLGARLRLEKRIPVASGLGGGSSDAAATLLALNRLWKLNRPIEHLHAIAAELGSDVPFFLHGPSSVCTGRGQIVRPTLPPAPRWAVLVLPSIALPTVAVYRRFDELRLGDRESILAPVPTEQWAALSASPLLQRLVNDLESPAFDLCPQLGKLRDAIERNLDRAVRMSGSGSSLFTLFDEQRQAQHAAEQIGTQFTVRALCAQLAPLIADDLARGS